MDNNIESSFINDYIVKERRERLLFELGSVKKRETAIMRFSHNAEGLINLKKIIYCNEALTEKQAIDFFKTKRINKFYIVSLGRNDKCVLSFEDALAYCFSEYMPVILIGEGYSFLKCESEYGTSKKIILQR